MKKPTIKLLPYCLVILLFYLFSVTTFAQEATTSQELIKEKIKERLEKSISGEIKGIQEEIKTKKKAFIGLITNIKGNILVLETDFGSREASISAETDIFYYESGGAQTEIEASDLTKKDYIILMGVLKNSLLNVKRAVKMPEPEIIETRKLIFGKILEIDDLEIQLDKGADGVQENTLLELEKNTPIEIKGKAKAEIEDIQIGDQLYAIVVIKNGKITSVKNILVLPGKNNPLSEENLKEATEAAEASPLTTP